MYAAGRPGRPLAVGPAARAALGGPFAGVAARVPGELHVLAKGLAAWAQREGLSPGWSFSRRMSADDLVKRPQHRRHRQGFSSVCF